MILTKSIYLEKILLRRGTQLWEKVLDPRLEIIFNKVRSGEFSKSKAQKEATKLGLKDEFLRNRPQDIWPDVNYEYEDEPTSQEYRELETWFHTRDIEKASKNIDLFTEKPYWKDPEWGTLNDREKIRLMIGGTKEWETQVEREQAEKEKEEREAEIAKKIEVDTKDFIYEAKKLGAKIDWSKTKSSSLSNSEYVYFWILGGTEDESEEVRVRISDHSLPPTYRRAHGETDFEIGVVSIHDYPEQDGDINEALVWLRKKMKRK